MCQDLSTEADAVPVPKEIISVADNSETPTDFVVVYDISTMLNVIFEGKYP